MTKPARLPGLMILSVCLFAVIGTTDVSWGATPRVSAGGNHSVAVKSDGTLWGWGENSFGQVGDGTLISRNQPLKIGIDSNWTAISAGFYHTVALKSDGTLWAWGDNTKGQLGSGPSTPSQSAPVRIGTDTDWTEVAAGDFHTLARKTDGSLWAWGENTSGQVGSGAVVPGNQAVPVRIGTESDWLTIAAGGSHSLALKANHTLWGWGFNAAGQLGNGTGIDAAAPVQIVPEPPFISIDWSVIAAGRSQSAAIKQEGTLWGWGDISVVRPLNMAQYVNVPSPQAGGAASWVAVSVGDSHFLGRGGDGTLWSWGENENGQLGHGNDFDAAVPGKVGVDTDWAEIDAGSLHTLALKTNGTLWSWGDNASGQLGDATSISRYSPVQIPLTQPVATGVTLTANQPSPHAVGAPVTFTASGAGGSGSYEYRFYLNDGSGAGFILQRDYDPVGTWVWTPAATGNYDIFVEVRSSGSTALRDAYTAMYYYQVKSEIPPTGVTLLSDVASPKTPGTPIVFTATANGGTGPCEYRFYLNDGSGAGFVLQGPGYSAVNTFSWTPAATGNYDIFVETRLAETTVLRDAFAVISFFQVTSTLPPTGITLTPNAGNSRTPGSPQTFTAAASGGTGPYEYRFYLNDGSGTGFILQGPYSPVDTFTWTPAATGSYDIFVETRLAGTTAFRDAYTALFAYRID